MADPDPYVPGYSYSGWQASNPTKPLPAPQVDNDFANIAQSTVELADAIKDVRRSDGALKNKIVTVDSVDDTLLALIKQGATYGTNVSAASLVYRIDSFANAAHVDIPDEVSRVFVEDRRAHFRRVETEPTHALKFQNGSQWWEIDEQELTPEMAGAVAGEVCTDALQAVFEVSDRWPVLIPASLYLTAGNHDVPRSCTIYGTGWRSRIKAVDGSNYDYIVKIGGDDAVTMARFDNLELDGNKANNPDALDGFVIVRPYKFFPHRLRVTGAKRDGIRLQSAGGAAFENYLRDISSYANGGVGVRMTGPVTDTHILGGDIGYNEDGGVVLSTSCSVRGATIWGGGQPDSRGVVTSGSNIRIADCNIEGHGQHGVVVNNDNREIDIENCRMYANSFTAENTGLFDAIYIGTGTSGSVKGCTTRSAMSSVTAYSMRFAVHFAGAHSPWTIIGNDFPKLAAGNPVGYKTTGPIVDGILSTDKADFNWVRTQVLASISGNVTPASSGAWIVLPLDVEAVDVLSEYASGTFTLKNTGRYRIDVAMTYLPSADQEAAGLALFTTAGVEIRRGAYVRCSGTGSVLVKATFEEWLTAGTAYDIRYWAGNVAGAVVAGAAVSYVRIGGIAN